MVVRNFRSDIEGEEIQYLSTGSQESMRNIVQDKIHQTAFVLRVFEEQRAIVAEVERCLSVIEELQVSVQTNLTRSERLRQSIFQQAFSGRLLSASTRSPSLKTSKGIVAETSSFGSSIR